MASALWSGALSVVSVPARIEPFLTVRFTTRHRPSITTSKRWMGISNAVLLAHGGAACGMRHAAREARGTALAVDLECALEQPCRGEVPCSGPSPTPACDRDVPTECVHGTGAAHRVAVELDEVTIRRQSGQKGGSGCTPRFQGALAAPTWPSADAAQHRRHQIGVGGGLSAAPVGQ